MATPSSDGHRGHVLPQVNSERSLLFSSNPSLQPLAQVCRHHEARRVELQNCFKSNFGLRSS